MGTTCTFAAKYNYAEKLILSSWELMKKFILCFPSAQNALVTGTGDLRRTLTGELTALPDPQTLYPLRRLFAPMWCGIGRRTCD